MEREILSGLPAQQPGNHPTQHVVLADEVVIQGRTDVNRDQEHQQQREQSMDCEDRLGGSLVRSDDARQPVLLSTSTDAPNLARNMLIADGQWREAALGCDRAFYLFDAATLEGARLAWKLLAGRDGVERRYWAQDDGGKWVEKG